MTDNIEWGEALTGPEIKALGLPGETLVASTETGSVAVYRVNKWKLNVEWPFYRLPVDHPAYIIHRYNKEHRTNFVYWPGGDEAPEDWDGGEVLSRGLVVRSPTYLNGSRWGSRTVPDFFAEKSLEFDIIGYNKEPQLVTEEASEPLQGAASSTAPANHGPAADDKGEAGEFIPCERTVRLAIEKLGYAKVSGYAYGDAKYAEQHKICVDAVKSLLPQPEPDRAEELLALITEDGEEMDSDHRHSMRTAIRRLIERGEIKG